MIQTARHPLRLDAPPREDFLLMDRELTDDDRLLRDTVRRFVTEQVLPHVGGWYAEGIFPAHLVKELGQLGLLGMHLEGYGCAGSTATQYGMACLELEAGDSGLRSFVSVQGSLAMFPIRAYGSEEQRQAWLPGMASGEFIGCFGLTEPDSGSDPGSMRTVARRDGSDWVLSGTKMWITNAPIADVAVLWARDASDDGRVRGFVVPTATPGVEIREVPGKLSLRASSTGEISLNEVRLPADAVLLGVSGLRGPLSCLHEARFGILWGVVGAARASYLAALDYAISRVQFGDPIAARQLVQDKLATMMADVTAGELLALRLGRLKDEGALHAAHISLGKRQNVAMALSVARTARTVLGASGITVDYPPMRHAANLESVLTYEGTHEIHSLILGEALTGIQAFS